MAEKSTLARPYALAAFKQAREEEKLNEWSEMLHFLAAIVTDPVMLGVLAHPQIGKDRISSLVLDICEDRLSPTGQNFVRVLAEHGRLALMPEIVRLFEQESANFNKRSRVEVITAYRIPTKQQQTIKEAMERRLGQEIDLSVTIDRSLIGGVIIHAGDLVIDASLRGRLEHLSLELA
jgi:F-type H+-transporting ATPase subunit delta